MINKTLTYLLSIAVSASLAAAGWHAKKLIEHDSRISVVETKIDRMESDRREILASQARIEALLQSIDVRLARHEGLIK